MTVPASPPAGRPAGPPDAGMALMLLADGRFPAGGHAHSAGVEAACAEGRIVDEATLAAFVEGRLHTTGLVDAALASATVLLLATGPSAADLRRALAALDAEADARIAAPPLRAASRKLGRQLVRVAGRCWPDSTLAQLPGVAPDGVHQSVALGAVGVAAGLSADVVARLSLHHAVTTPTQAAVRLLGLDPFGVAAVSARLAPVAERIAGEAVAAARSALGGDRGTSAGASPVAAIGHEGVGAVLDLAGLADLPALGGPLVEIAAVEHRTWDVRMFAT